MTNWEDFSSALLRLSRATSGQNPNFMPNWIGDQMAGVRPEATPVLRAGIAAESRGGVWRGGVRLTMSVFRPFRLAVPW